MTSITPYSCSIYNAAIPRYSVTPLVAPINIKIVASIPGYPFELNHHNALTFSQRAAPGYPGLLIPVEDRHQPHYANNE